MARTPLRVAVYDMRSHWSKNHPYDFSAKVGDDIYLNPWWGRDMQRADAVHLCNMMDSALGQPDLWCDGIPRLLWGPRHLNMSWRPSFTVNFSGPQNRTYFGLWLPWRGQADGKGNIFKGNILDKDVNLIEIDIAGLGQYSHMIGMPKNALGDAIAFADGIQSEKQRENSKNKAKFINEGR